MKEVRAPGAAWPAEAAGPFPGAAHRGAPAAGKVRKHSRCARLCGGPGATAGVAAPCWQAHYSRQRLQKACCITLTSCLSFAFVKNAPVNRNTFVIGFMLFAIFFGAGNLIFPSALGMESGPGLWEALLGFVLTGVGLPLLAIIVSAYYDDGYRTALDRIHPWFSLAFLAIVYLTVGPFFAIPRTGATSFELAVLPFLTGGGAGDAAQAAASGAASAGADAGAPGQGPMLLFSLVYFGVALWLSLNPSKMVERIGAILTPVLLVCILLLIGKGVLWLHGRPPTLTQVEGANGSIAFVNGFMGGYLTMDVLGSVAYAVIVLTAVRSKMGTARKVPAAALPDAEAGVAADHAPAVPAMAGEGGGAEGAGDDLPASHGGDEASLVMSVAHHSALSRRELVVQASLAGVVAAVSLAVIYVGLGWVSNRLPIDPSVVAGVKASGKDLGSFLLNTAAYGTFGEFGRILFGVIVTLACLTTAVGLITATSEYFNDVWPRISYRTYAIICTLGSFAVANQGLAAVISKSVPVLLVLYPIVMTLLVLMLLENFVWKPPVLSQRLAVGFVTAVSVLSVAGVGAVNRLPWKEYSLEWAPFAALGIVLGLAGRRKRA